MLRALALLLVGIMSLSSVSIAEGTKIAADNKVADSKIENRKFYLKAMADRGFFQKSKLDTDQAARKYKNKSMVNSADFGAGYYFNDEFRGEILFHQEYNNKFTQSASVNVNSNGRVVPIPAEKTLKNNLYALMLGVNMNVVDFDYGKLFLSGNVGVSQVKEKYSVARTGVAEISALSVSGKKQNNLAYGVGVGADFKLSERLHAEIAYRFSDYGQTKSLKNTAGREVGKIKLRSHNALVGLRVDM